MLRPFRSATQSNVEGRKAVSVTVIVFFAVVLALTVSPLRGVMIKPGVSLIGLQPPMLMAQAEAREVYREHGYIFVITSGLEGKHGVGSLHFVGLALDYRVRSTEEYWPGGIWNIPLPERRVMARELRDRLGAQYDVVLKPDHLHSEFQPKVGTNL